MIFLLAMLAGWSAPGAPEAATPVSLRTVSVPKPANLFRFVADEAAAIGLGKALFWDMQLGSDGTVACASCHFHAGTDNRSHNTASAGGSGTFDVTAPNGAVQPEDFPFHKMADRHNRGTGGLDPNDPAVVSSRDDVVGAQGVVKTGFQAVQDGHAVDRGQLQRDANFTSNARNLRQVTGRNAPSVINAVFNFANFLDGRANHYFNGSNPFGVQDVNARVVLNAGGVLVPLNLVDADDPGNQLDNSSLASQAVGPPRTRWKCPGMAASGATSAAKCSPSSLLAGRSYIRATACSALSPTIALPRVPRGWPPPIRP